jgi:hypothetical protein
MRTALRSATIEAMPKPGAERIVLELDPGDPINGRIHCPPGVIQTFRGWLELATKIERLRGERAYERSKGAIDLTKDRSRP